VCHAVPGAGSPECHPGYVAVGFVTHQGWQPSVPNRAVSQLEIFQTGLRVH
jgi:hypothetical protein